MSNVGAAFLYLQNSILNSLNTAMPAKVLSFDSVTCTAKIQPLYKVEENNEFKSRAPLEGVPVLKQRYRMYGDTEARGSVEMIPNLQPGDIVFIVMSQRTLDEAIKGNEANSEGRRFSIKDAVILGVF